VRALIQIVMAFGSLALFPAAPVAAIYPGWKKANALRPEGILPFLLPLAGIVLWYAVFLALSYAGIKGGSGSNALIESFAMSWAAVAVAYVRFRILGSRLESRAGAVTVVALLCAAILIRSLVPEMGE
jgi:hypothetical protein